MIKNVFRKLLRRYPGLRALLSRGIIGYTDFRLNRRLIWEIDKNLISNSTDNPSSISETMPYIDVCKMAVEDERYFEIFKSNKEYREVLEHCDYFEGLSYLALLNQKSKEYLNLFQITSRDSGSPQRFTYPNLGRISPTQIRYAKVLQDIHNLFGSLDALNIAEIGVGYGGQAIHIMQSNEINSYKIYDLEWPAKLALKYISQNKIPNLPKLEIEDFLTYSDSDLVISNYAFSELARDIQEIYLKNVILGSPKGYFIYNHIHSNSNDSLSAREFAARISGAKIYEEVPLTFPGNVLVAWGHNEANLPLDLFKRV